MLILNSLFQDGAVFQQKKVIPVWGNTEKNCILKAEFAGQTVFTRASLSGKFIFRFAPVQAGGPFELKVTNLSSGEIFEAGNILVGEVWLASGQSNMEYKLDSNWAVVPPFNNENFEFSGINEKQLEEFCSTTRNTDKLRYFSVARNISGTEEDMVEGTWEDMSPDAASGCSAAAAWFARYIQEKLAVPVGIIVSAVGGMIAEAWTSRNALLSNPDTYSFVSDRDKIFARQNTWCPDDADKSKGQENLKEYADPGNKGVEYGWADPDFDASSWSDFSIPGSWISQKISGNGVIWARKKILIPENWCGREVILNFGGIDKTDITYFNGVEIGRTGEGFDTESWNKPRKYTIPAGLIKPGENVIAVRAYSFCFDGAFNGLKKHYYLACGDETIPLNGDWHVRPEVDFGVVKVTVAKESIHPNVPSILFDGMIKPLLPYSIRGAIWYQGESNAGAVSEAESYYGKLQTMINDWRYLWENGDFPFIQVQLANYFRGNEDLYDRSSPWAVLRDVQRKLCDDMKNVYMVSAVDIGEFHDIHPQDKKSVGRRLADNALCNVYHCNGIVPSGPLFDGFSIEGNQVRIKFRYAEGMYLKENGAQSFYIAGSSQLFYPADSVKVEGSSILVSSSKVAEPQNVRYAWADYPVSTLYNGAELPASPFRTDDWKL